MKLIKTLALFLFFSKYEVIAHKASEDNDEPEIKNVQKDLTK
jgi:hypothetical protein